MLFILKLVAWSLYTCITIVLVFSISGMKCFWNPVKTFFYTSLDEDLLYRLCCELASVNQNNILFPESCQEAINITSGMLNITTDGQTTKAVYTCSSAYEMEGNAILSCLANGTWDSDPPICCNNIIYNLHIFTWHGNTIQAEISSLKTFIYNLINFYQ